jgi:hypothetical protein
MKDSWPKREDGSKKPMREMTDSEQRHQFKLAVKRLKAKFERPEVSRKIVAAVRMFED